MNDVLQDIVRITQMEEHRRKRLIWEQNQRETAQDEVFKKNTDSS